MSNQETFVNYFIAPEAQAAMPEPSMPIDNQSGLNSYDNSRRHSERGAIKINGRRGAIMGAGTLVVAGVFVAGGLSRGGEGTTAAGSSPVDRSIEDLVTVNYVDPNFCPTKIEESGGTVVKKSTGEMYKFVIGALSPPVKDGGKRLWDDALNTPLTSTTPAAQLVETQARGCIDPLQAVTEAHFFAHMNVEGVSVASRNDWLKPYENDASNIANQAAAFIDTLDASSTQAQIDDATQKFHQEEKLAAYVGTLEGRFDVIGDQSLQSTSNYHLALDGAMVGGMPGVELNPTQENLPALVLGLSKKNETCGPVKVIGFNIGDVRPEELVSPVVCTTTTPGQSSHQTPSPSQTTHCVPNPKIEGSCGSGKDHRTSPPPPSGLPTKTCGNGYLDRNTGQCVNHPYTPYPTHPPRTLPPTTSTPAPAPSESQSPVTNPPTPKP